jgi:hypothetical protein
VVTEHHLVLALENVVANERACDDVEVQLFLDFARDCRLRILFGFEITRDQGKPPFGPQRIAREDDLTVVLD